MPSEIEHIDRTLPANNVRSHIVNVKRELMEVLSNTQVVKSSG